MSAPRLNPHKEAITAACRAFARSRESVGSSFEWPGTLHIEAAVEEYLRVAQPVPTEPERDKLWCRALIATLSVDDLQKVLATFNTLRRQA